MITVQPPSSPPLLETVEQREDLHRLLHTLSSGSTSVQDLRKLSRLSSDKKLSFPDPAPEDDEAFWTQSRFFADLLEGLTSLLKRSVSVASR
jgi:hypothetical protein